MQRMPWHAAAAIAWRDTAWRLRRFLSGRSPKSPMQPKECVGAVFPTQLPNLVVNVLFAIARDGTVRLADQSSQAALPRTCDSTVLRAGTVNFLVDRGGTMALETCRQGGVQSGAQTCWPPFLRPVMACNRQAGRRLPEFAQRDGACHPRQFIDGENHALPV
jgi:hypothetical protein